MSPERREYFRNRRISVILHRLMEYGGRLGSIRDIERRSLSNWTISEMMNELIEHKDIPPEVVFEQFIQKMDRYSCQNNPSSYRFSIAKDIAQDAFDYICISPERRR